MDIHFEGLSNASTSTQLPAGTYVFEIESVDPNYESQEKGSKAMEVKAHIVEGVDFDDGSSTFGLQRTLRFWYPHKDQRDGGKFCLGRLNEFVKSCGVETAGDRFDDQELVGKTFQTRCRIKLDNQGRANEEFDKFKMN